MAYKDDKKFSAEDFLSFEAIDDLFNSENKYYLKDIDTNDANGYTPLCAAILNNADPLMLLYLTAADVAEAEPSINTRNCLPKEFRFSVKNQDFIPTHKLPKRASITKTCGKGKTPLQVAIMAGNATAIKTLLGKYEVTLDAQEYVCNKSYSYYKKLIYYDDSCQPIYETDSEGNPTEEYKYYKIKIKLYENYYNNLGNDEKITISNKDILSAASMPTSDVLDALADKYTKDVVDKNTPQPEESVLRLHAWNNDDFNDLHDTPMIVAAKAQCYDSIKTIIKGITGSYSLAPDVAEKQNVALAVWHRNLTEPNGDKEDTCVNDIAAENNDEGLIEVLSPYCRIIRDTDDTNYPPPASSASGTYPSNSSDPSVTAEASQVGSEGNNLSVKIEKSANDNAKAVVKIFEEGNDEPAEVSQELTADESGDISLDNIQSSSGNILNKVKLNGKIRFTDIQNEEGITIQLSGGKNYLEDYLQSLDRLTVDEFLVSAFKLKDDYSIAKFTFDSLRNNNEDSKEVNIFNLPNDSGTSDDDLLLFSSYEYDYTNTSESSSDSGSEEIIEDNSEESENESEESDNVDRSKYKNILSIINENLNIVDEDNESEDTVTLYDLIKNHIGDLPASARSGHSFKRDFCTETEDVIEGQACYNLINKLYSDGTLDSLDNGLNYISVLSDIEGDNNDKLPNDFHRKVGTLKRCNSNTVSFKTEYLYLANFKSSYPSGYINSWVSPSIKPEDINDIYSYEISEIDGNSKYQEVEVYTLDSNGNPVIVKPTHFSISRSDNITVSFRTKDNDNTIKVYPNNSAVIVKLKTAIEINNDEHDEDVGYGTQDDSSALVIKSFDLSNSGIYEIDETNVWWRQSKPLYKLLRGKAISEIVKENKAGFVFDVDSPDLQEGEVTKLAITLLSKPDANITVAIETDENNNGRLSLSSDIVEFTPDDWDVPHLIDLEAVHDYIAYGNINVSVTLIPSGDYNYDRLDEESFTVSIQDIDEAGIEYDESPISLIEGGDPVSLKFNLKSKPLEDITVGFTGYDQNRLEISSTQLVFTQDDWGEPQEVILTAIDDEVDNSGTIDTTITISLSGDGGSYDSVTDSLLRVTIENNDTAGVEYSSKEDIELIEGGQSVTREFWLSSKPESSVTLNFLTSNTSRLTVTPSSLTFTPSNWESHLSVTLAPATDNNLVEGDVDVTVSITVDESSDLKYLDLELDSINVRVLDNDKPGLLYGAVQSSLAEGEESAILFKLKSQPTNDVIITLNSNNDRLTVVSQSLTLTPSDFINTISRGSTIIAIANDIDDDDITAQVTASVTSTDPNYNNIQIPPFDIEIIDDDTAGLDYTINSVTLVEGMSTTRLFKLKSQPTSDVTLIFTPNKPSNITITPSSLTITQSNWDANHAITLRAVNNSTVTGKVSVNVSITVESNDIKYSSLKPTPFIINITDNDTADVLVSLQKESLTEGDSGSLFYQLKSRPTDNVVLNFESDNSRLKVSPSTRIITPGNYNDDFQYVTLTAVDNTTVDGDTSATISITTTSYDNFYNNLSYGFVVNIKDNDKVTPSKYIVSYKNTDHTNLNNVRLPGDLVIINGGRVILETPPKPNEYRESDSNIRWVAKGWRTSAGLFYNFGDTVKVNSDTTFYLVCEKKQVNVTYVFKNPRGITIRDSEVKGPYISGSNIRLYYVNLVQADNNSLMSFKVDSPYTINNILWVPKEWDIGSSKLSFGTRRTIFDNITADLTWERPTVTLTYAAYSDDSKLNIQLPAPQQELSGTAVYLETPSKLIYTYNNITYKVDYWVIGGSRYSFGYRYALKQNTYAYAHVSTEQVTITYKNNTGISVDLPKPNSVNKGRSVTLPTIEGTYSEGGKKWKVTGWSIGSETYDSGEEYILTKDVDAWLHRTEIGGSLGTVAFVTSAFAISDFDSTAKSEYDKNVPEEDRVYEVEYKYNEYDT